MQGVEPLALGAVQRGVVGLRGLGEPGDCLGELTDQSGGERGESAAAGSEGDAVNELAGDLPAAGGGGAQRRAQRRLSAALRAGDQDAVVAVGGGDEGLKRRRGLEKTGQLADAGACCSGGRGVVVVA